MFGFGKEFKIQGNKRRAYELAIFLTHSTSNFERLDVLAPVSFRRSPGGSEFRVEFPMVFSDLQLPKNWSVLESREISGASDYGENGLRRNVDDSSERILNGLSRDETIETYVKFLRELDRKLISIPYFDGLIAGNLSKGVDGFFEGIPKKDLLSESLADATLSASHIVGRNLGLTRHLSFNKPFRVNYGDFEYGGNFSFDRGDINLTDLSIRFLSGPVSETSWSEMLTGIATPTQLRQSGLDEKYTLKEGIFDLNGYPGSTQRIYFDEQAKKTVVEGGNEGARYRLIENRSGGENSFLGNETHSLSLRNLEKTARLLLDVPTDYTFEKPAIEGPGHPYLINNSTKEI